jgi:predicted dehydrogenase
MISTDCRLRIALAGCGRWGSNILRDLLTLGTSVAVADPAPERRAFALAAGAEEAASDLRELASCDGIVIATPASTHVDVARQALVAGVPVFIEKPFTTTAESARRLAEEGCGRLFVMEKWRYHPGIVELKRISETLELGRPLGMRLLQVGWGSPQHDVDIAWTLLPHCLSIALEVLGTLPPVRHAFAEQLNGAIVGVNAVLGDDPWIVVEVSDRAPVKRREFRLHCENGVAWLDHAGAPCIRLARGGPRTGDTARDVEARPIGNEMPLLCELREFVNHLQGGPPPRGNAEQSALAVERIETIRAIGTRVH